MKIINAEQEEVGRIKIRRKKNMKIINALEREGGVKLVMLIETLKYKTEYRGGYKNTELIKTFAYNRGSFQST